MASAVLNNGGQTTIPQEVMDRLKLRQGDRVEFVVQENGTAMLSVQAFLNRDLFHLINQVHFIVYDNNL